MARGVCAREHAEREEKSGVLAGARLGRKHAQAPAEKVRRPLQRQCSRGAWAARSGCGWRAIRSARGSAGATMGTHTIPVLQRVLTLLQGPCRVRLATRLPTLVEGVDRCVLGAVVVVAAIIRRRLLQTHDACGSRQHLAIWPHMPRRLAPSANAAARAQLAGPAPRPSTGAHTMPWHGRNHTPGTPVPSGTRSNLHGAREGVLEEPSGLRQQRKHVGGGRA